MSGEPRGIGGRLWDEPGTVRRGRVAQVATLAPLDRLYSYAIPGDLVDTLRPGQRVEIPFGSKDRAAVGFCVAISDEPWTSSLKPIRAVVDPIALISPHLLELGRWMSRYYCCPLGRTLSAMVPEAVVRRSGFRTVRKVRPRKRLEQLQEAGCRLGPKQRVLLTYLGDRDEPIELAQIRESLGVSSATIAGAAKRGWVEITVSREPVPGPSFDRPMVEPAFELNADQEAALARLDQIITAGQFRATLLFGVSGSGKTEVYVRAMRRVVAAGRQAILLVPEIALTAQTVHRLASRFRDVAVIHSGLTPRQRSLSWYEIARGRKRVVIGTRSAVFAPCPDLGLIAVDEEQEPSYKNQQSPRYNARDVAIKRAQLASIPIMLGSATPSLETWTNAQRHERYECIRLPRRVAGLPMPTVHVLEMRIEHRARKGVHLLSRLMEQKLGEALQRGEQAVLLLNRRGYASYLFCPSCGRRIVCPNCKVNMVFHKTIGQAVCHYCRARFNVPRKCPDDSCGHTLVRFGVGTQRVEEEVRAKFPSARVVRVDTDTMRRAEQYERVVTEFENRRIDVLVGTQMIAKGLDFPFVSFVGVVSADTALAVPDFRAGERTFQLVTQVAGRAGRAETPGEVVVQSFATDLHAVRAAVGQDFEQFVRVELATRRAMHLPPYARLTRIVLSDPRDSRARRQAEELAERICQTVLATNSQADCLGPSKCPLERLRNQYRYDLLLRAPSATVMQKLLDRLRGEQLLISAGVKRLVVDVDPVSLL